jgi:hypothetical protein
VSHWKPHTSTYILILISLDHSDQFCSLVFTLSNLFLFVCVYSDGIDENWRQCGSSNPLWPVAFALASLPSFVRLVQSVRRYADSKLVTHLINVCSSMFSSGTICNLYIVYRAASMVLQSLLSSSFICGDTKVGTCLTITVLCGLQQPPRKRPRCHFRFVVSLQYSIFCVRDLLGGWIIHLILLLKPIDFPVGPSYGLVFPANSHSLPTFKAGTSVY